MKKLFFVIFSMMLSISSTYAQVSEESETGLKVPRMVSLRSNHINTRSGPGARYPIEWVYMQKGAPVEIIAEFELWRKIKDWEGAESWVHKSMLTSTRSVKVTAVGENNLYAKPDYESRLIAKIEDQVVGLIQKCPAASEFCQIKFNNFEGWIPRTNIFGIYSEEVID